MRNVSKRFLFILMASFLLIISSASFVQASSQIEIHLRKGQTDRDLQGRQLKLWKISNEKLTGDLTEELKKYEKHTDDQLNEKFGEPLLTEKSDINGKIVVKNLEKGTYYVREVGDKEYKTAPFFILIPMDEDIIETKVEVKKPTEPTEPTKPTEPTGEYHFLKVDGDGKNPLKNAVFKVNVKKGDYYKDYLVNGKPYIIKSDSKGKFVVEGLPYGTYYLKEIIPPEGYKVLSETIKFEISGESDKFEIVIKNNKEETTPKETTPKETEKKEKKKKIKVPKTGDITLIVMVIAGALLFYIGKKLIKE
ncbi:SpaA isopeptide-forming pilin-related protein [Lagierella sp. ICN-221743]